MNWTNMMPNFLIVGVPKAGTSSLYEYLRVHPEIFLPKQKELHFFSSSDLLKKINGPGDKLALSNIIKDKKKYLDFYKDVTNEKAIGDISPSYLFFSNTAIPLIKKHLTNKIKIIITLRDPIDRAYSNYLHQKRLLHESLQFAEAIKIESNRKKYGYGDFWQYKEHSLYYEKCDQFIKEFGKQNVKIILFEDIKTNPVKTIQGLCDFLGIEAKFELLNTGKVYNKGGIYKKNKLTEFLLKPSFFKETVRKLVGEKSGNYYKRVKDKVLSKSIEAKPKIDDETLTHLRAFFSEDVKKLEALGVNTSKWKYF